LQFFVGKIWENDEKNYDENHGVAFFWPIFRQSRMYDWEGSLHLSKGTTFSGCSALPLARKHPLTYHISLSPARPYLPNQGSPKSNVKENKTASPCTIYQVCTYSQSSEEFPPLFQPWNNNKQPYKNHGASHFSLLHCASKLRLRLGLFEVVEPGGAILRTPRYAMATWKEITSSCSRIR